MKIRSCLFGYLRNTYLLIKFLPLGKIPGLLIQLFLIVPTLIGLKSIELDTASQQPTVLATNPSVIEEEKVSFSGATEQTLAPHQISSQPFEQILASLHDNNPQVYAISLTHEQLNQEKLQQLKEAIDNNSVIGYIQWGEIPADCEQITEQIQEKLTKNIYTYTYYPSDYVHGLLAYHVYTNPKLGQKIDLTVVSKEIGHKLPANIHTSWKVVQVKDDSKHTGYYSALYINEITHQAILAFQGTKVEGLRDLTRKHSDLKEDIDGILGNAITQQNALAYVATKDAVDYTRTNEFNLSITGHSLGGYLAELAVAFCYRDFSYRQTRGIVFDSPGTVNKLDKFKPNVINKATKFSIANLPIITYLSAPNLINTCNGHPGEVYRVYPQLMWSAEIQKWMKRASKVPLIGSKVKGNNKGLLALTGHSLATILGLFDPTTGKPSTYIRIADWPKLDTDNIAYIGKRKQELEKNTLLKSSLSILTGKTNVIGSAFQILPSLIGGTTASVVNVLKDCLNINQAQYWTTLAYLDDSYQETKLNSQKEFNLRYKGHYRISEHAMNEHVLYTENYEGVDWYLYELYQYKNKLEQTPIKDLTSTVLKSILQDYEVVSLDEQPYIRLVEKQSYVEALRDKMQRSIKVLSVANIKKALEDSNIYALTKELEKRSIQQFTQLHNYIAQAKLTTYLVREDKQQELSQKLNKEGVCVVYGHGGVGKSTLVAQYGHRQKDKQLVRWMQAETTEKLLKSYQDLAHELGIDYQKLAQGFKESYHNYLPELSRRVYNALEDRKQSVLLILDNATDANLIDNCLLYRTDLVQVIITTRKAKNFSVYSQVKLAAFKKEEGIQYIKKCFESSLYQPNEQEIAALIEEVGLIPQNLALAVGYIGQKRLMTVQGYINKLQEIKKLEKVEEKQFVLPEVSLGLESLGLQAQLVMRYGAYLDPDFIPLSLISALVEVKDEEVLESLLGTLEELSLITIIKGQGNELGIQIHREIQAASKHYKGWINASSISEEELLLSIIKVLHDYMPRVIEIPDGTWDQAKIYATNVAHVLVYIGKTLKTTTLLADLTSRMGNYNQQVERNFEQALKYYQQAFEMRQTLYIGNHPQVAEAFNNVGSLYKALGNHQQSLKYYQQALEIRKALYTGNHPDIAESITNVGLSYKALGQYQEALKYLKQALQMRQALYTGNHPQIAEAFNNIGSIYKALGQYQEALKYLKQALQMRQALYTGNHPHVAQSFNSLGLIYKALSQYQEALKYLNQALEMRQALYTGNHPQVAQSSNNVGSVYKTLGQYQEALKYYQQALEMKKRLYMGNHPSIALSLNNLGDIYKGLGQYQEALKYYQQALEMRKTLYTGNHPSIAISLNNLGDFYQALGQHQEALKYYQQALEMKQYLYTGNHPDIAVSLNDLGNVYQALGQYQEALKYYQQALEMLKAVYTDNHPDIAISLDNLGNVYQALGQYQEAFKYYQQALGMLKAVYRDSHPDIALVLDNLGSIYKALGNYQEALKYNQQALEMRKASYTGNHPRIAESFHNVGSTYEVLGQYQEALKYYQQALEMRQAVYIGNHPHIAASFSNIGDVYKALGQYQEALKYYQQALEMRKDFYTGNHPRIAASLSDMGDICKALGQYQEALKYYQQALQMKQHLYKGNHPSIARSYNNVGSVYEILGRYQEALKYYQQALEMQKHLYMDNHPDIAISFNSLGSVYQALGQYQEALKYYQQAFEMMKVLYTGNHPHVAILLNNLGSIYQALGQHQEALKYYHQALKMKQHLYTGNHPDIAVSLNDLGNVYQTLGQYQEALKYYQQAFEMRKILYICNHPDRAISLNNLGNIYKALGQYQEALKYYQQALEMRKELYPCNHPDIVISLNKLGDIYTTLGQHQEALKYYQQALEMRQALYTNNLAQ